MNEYITESDYKLMESYIESLENSISIESKKLAEAAAHGGSVPAFMPEYQAIESKIHSYQEELSNIKNRLHELETVTEDEIPLEIVTNYKLVELENVANKAISKLYIIDSELLKAKNIKPLYPLATPKSPLVKLLLGKKVGDRVTLALPNNQTEYIVSSLENLFL